MKNKHFITCFINFRKNLIKYFNEEINILLVNGL